MPDLQAERSGDAVIGDRYFVTIMAFREGVYWDLRSGHPDEASVRIAEGYDAHTFAAALHQAGTALQGHADDLFGRRQ